MLCPDDAHLRVPIFAIDRLRMGTDGHGVTTLVCFMGCPLRCAYCINDQCHGEVMSPDGLTPRKSILSLTPRELYERVKRDNIYFQATGGGICFGGGEPTLYSNFILAFRRLCPPTWRITMETALRCGKTDLERLAPIVDLWIFDVKSTEAEVYEKYTGQPSRLQECAATLQELGVMNKVIAKVPLIPDFNTEEEVERSVQQLRSMGFGKVVTMKYLKHRSKYPPKKTYHER